MNTVPLRCKTKRPRNQKHFNKRQRAFKGGTVFKVEHKHTPKSSISHYRRLITGWRSSTFGICFYLLKIACSLAPYDNTLKVTFSCYSSDFCSLNAPPKPAPCQLAGCDINVPGDGLCARHSPAEYLSSVVYLWRKQISELLNRTLIPHDMIHITTKKYIYIERNPGMQCVSMLLTPSQLFEEMS